MFCKLYKVISSDNKSIHGGDFDGNWNTGNCNTGNWNTGNWNTGNWNTGDSNTGDSNTGGWNTGDSNTGDGNTGHCNTGNCNTGNWNTGDWNTGNWNTGNWNTGNWNTVDRETGFFNNNRPKTVNVFNKPCAVEKWESAKKPSFIYFDIDESIGYKESFKKSFENATTEDVEMLKSLPNFDADVFFEISGIDLR